MTSEIFEHTHESMVKKGKTERTKGKEEGRTGVNTVDIALHKLETLNRLLISAKEDKNLTRELELQSEITQLQHEVLIQLQQQNSKAGNISPQLAGISREAIVPAVSLGKKNVADGVGITAKSIFPQRLTNLAGIS